ncbi:MAG: kynureninase [Chloroflexi bacterium]|nr:kynureninase [Chloroflexota bacterium]
MDHERIAGQGRTDSSYADELDARDPLAHFRERFVVEEPDLIYLDGNSLGRLPKATLLLAEDLVHHQWGGRLIRGWNDSWFAAPERIGAKIARLIGASPDEVIVADSTSVNLFKLAIAALRLRPDRSQVLTDDLNFPSDLYGLHAATEMLGARHSMEIVRSSDGIYGPEADLLAALDSRTALLSLSHTTFKSGYTYDIALLTAAAHEAGALVLWDLSHSVGAMPIDLEVAGVDFAIGCTYKYLNGGPGAPAFLYVRRDLQDQIGNTIPGWMGQRDLFDFGIAYQPAEGIRRHLTGTPPVVSLALIEPGVDILLEAGIQNVRAKSLAQSAYLIELWEDLLAPLGFRLNSPRDEHRRGSHLAIGHDEALRIDLALIQEMNVIPDFRAPETIRLGIAPLYTTYRDLHSAVMRLRSVVAEGRYRQYRNESPVVT